MPYHVASHDMTSHVSTNISHILPVYDTAGRGSDSLDQSMREPSAGTVHVHQMVSFNKLWE